MSEEAALSSQCERLDERDEAEDGSGGRGDNGDDASQAEEEQSNAHGSEPWRERVGKETEALISQAEALAPDTRPYLEIVLGFITRMLQAEIKHSASRRVVEHRCRETLKFFCSIARYEKKGGSPARPGTYAHLLLFLIMLQLDIDSQDVEYLTRFAVSRQDQHRPSIVADWAYSFRRLRLQGRAYKNEVGLQDSRHRRIAGLAEPEQGLVTSIIHLRTLVQYAINTSWARFTKADPEPVHPAALERLYQLLHGLNLDDGEPPLEYELSVLDFKSSAEAEAWADDALEEARPIATELKDMRVTFPSERFPRLVLQYVAMLFRVNARDRADTFLLFIAAWASGKLRMDARDEVATLVFSKALSMLALCQHDEDQTLFKSAELAEEAVRVLEPWCESEASSFQKELAVALLVLVELGEGYKSTEELLALARRAVSIYLPLYEQSPDDVHIKAGLAHAHNLVGLQLDDLEDVPAACAAFRASIALYRELAEQVSAHFVTPLARLVGLLGKIMEEDDEEADEEAIRLSAESVTLMESRLEGWPTETKSHLVLRYLGHAVTLLDRDRYDAALEAASKSRDLCLEVSAETGAKQDLLLGVIYITRASILVAQEAYDDAHADAHAASELLHAIPHDDGGASPPASRPLESAALDLRAFTEWMRDDPLGALRTLLEAEQILRGHMKSFPASGAGEGAGAGAQPTEGAHEELANVLLNLGAVRCRLGDLAGALTTGREAVTVARRACAADADAQAQPEKSKSVHALAQALVFLSGTLLALGRVDEAEAASREGVEMMERAGTARTRRKTGWLVRVRVLEAVGGREEEVRAARAKAEALPCRGYAHMIGAP